VPLLVIMELTSVGAVVSILLVILRARRIGF